MAQRTVHYLFGEMIARQTGLEDKERFLLGSILPDAVDADDKGRSHFKVKTDTMVYIDFDAFQTRYFDRMLRDDLYLGYYMHLVEDAFYRCFVHQNRIVMPRTRAEVDCLHNDYHILNSYIVEKYRIHNILDKAVISGDETICNISAFHIQESLDKLSAEFMEQTHGTTVFLTEEILDKFIETYIPLAIKEVKCIKSGRSNFRTGDYTWPRRM